jgi:hypothetical protein
MERTNSSVNTVVEVIKQLEKEGETKVRELKATNALTIDSLSKVMTQGEEEFIKKTGRRMTYSEMRAIYG